MNQYGYGTLWIWPRWSQVASALGHKCIDGYNMLSCLSRESLILRSAKHPLVSFATDLAAAFAALTWNLKLGGMQNRTVPDCAMPLSSLARLCGYLMPETCHGAHGTKDFKLCVSTKTLQSFGGNIDDHFALHWPKSLGFSHNQTFEFDVGPSSSCSWGCSGLCCHSSQKSYQHIWSANADLLKSGFIFWCSRTHPASIWDVKLCLLTVGIILRSPRINADQGTYITKISRKWLRFSRKPTAFGPLHYCLTS